MPVSGVLPDFPLTTQNPLLPLEKFVEFCCKRFRNESPFALPKRLREAAEADVLQPLVAHDEHYFYAPAQVWQVQQLRRQHASIKPSPGIASFNDVLKLLALVQDYYLPEVRGNRRFGHWHDYDGSLALGGFSMRHTLICLVSNIRASRRDAIASGRFKPLGVLESVGMTPDVLAKWQFDLYLDATRIDPLRAWRDLVALIHYEERLKLKYDALLAQDYYELVELLRLFSVDTGFSEPGPEYTDPTDLSPREPVTAVPDWKLEMYGALPWSPVGQLEFITNGYGINPRPRAIVLTEGAEWQAIAELFVFYNFDPELLGLEFRSIHGVGNFTLANWQAFIEYMHEKHVLVFFVIDSEGEAPKQARRLLERKRIFPCDGLEKVIPADDRIKLWATSFEEDNFEDSEITAALSSLGMDVPEGDIAAARATGGSPGLVERIFARAGRSVSKPELCVALVRGLIEHRRNNPAGKKRPIEEFVEHCGELSVYNNQPNHADSLKANRESGYFG